jgi:hypothetical protein
MSASDTHLPTLTRLRNYNPLTRLRSDILPTELERAEIARLHIDAQIDASQANKEVASCEAEIKKLEWQAAQIQREAAKFRQKVVRITHEKEQMKSLLSVCDALSSSVLKLPADVLSEIFSYVAENDLTEYKWLGNSSLDSTFPMRWKIMGYSLERICSRWRRAAISTPALWSTISVAITSTKDLTERMHDKTAVPAMKTILKRSKEHPLEISLAYIDGDPRTNLLWPLLIEQQHRWHRLTIIATEDLQPPHNLSHALASITSLPSLERLEIYREMRWFVPMDVCPKLKSFSGVGIDIYSGKVGLPLGQIPSIELYYTFRDVAYRMMLEKFTSARNITVIPIDQPERELSVTLPSSCSALCIDMEIISGRVPITAFVAPSTLSSLEVHSGKDDEVPRILHLADFTQFLTQSKCTLTSLSIHWVKLDQGEIITLLGVVPALTRLSIKETLGINLLEGGHHRDLFYHFNIRRLQETTPDGLRFILLPFLQHLELNIFTNGVSDEDIVDIIIPRALRGLRFFNFHSQSHLLNTKVYDRLAAVVGPEFTALITADEECSESDGLSYYW